MGNSVLILQLTLSMHLNHGEPEVTSNLGRFAMSSFSLSQKRSVQLLNTSDHLTSTRVSKLMVPLIKY